MASDCDLDLLRLDGQRQAPFSPHFQTPGDGFANVGEGFIAGITLADTAWDRRAFGDPKRRPHPDQAWSGTSCPYPTLFFLFGKRLRRLENRQDVETCLDYGRITPR